MTNLPAIEISIVTAAYNADRYIRDAMKSVALQKDVSYEHIVVDDGSRDSTAQLILHAASTDNRIVPVVLKENVGAVAARNIAIARARGRYLAFLDADDIWLPTKLREQLQFMQGTGTAMSYTDYRHMSEDGQYVGRVVEGPSRLNWTNHHKTRFIGCLTVMIDRQAIPNFNFPTVAPAMRGEDFLAWAKALREIGHALRYPRDLARYRLVPSSRSSSKVKAARSIWKIYRDVEGLGVIRSIWYFSHYVVHASWKHLFCRPNTPAAIADS